MRYCSALLPVSGEYSNLDLALRMDEAEP